MISNCLIPVSNIFFLCILVYIVIIVLLQSCGTLRETHHRYMFDVKKVQYMHSAAPK